MSEDAALASTAAWGLPGSVLEPPPPMEGAEARSFVSQVVRQRLTGLAVSAANSGALQLDDPSVERLEQEHMSAMAGALVLEQNLLEVLELLASRGVDARVLKGSAVAHLDYADPALRSFGDCDLLVRSDDVERACAVLTAAGYERQSAEPRPGFDRRYGKGASFVHSRSGLEVDLHRTLCMGPFGVEVQLDELWDGVGDYVLGGRVVRGLGAEQRVLHAAYHAQLGNYPARWVPLRDLAEMLLFGSADTTRVVEVARSWHGQVVLAAAVRQAWTRLGIADVTALKAWADEYRPTAQEQQWLSLYTDGNRSYAAKSVATLQALPSWGDRLRFGMALALPGADFRKRQRAGVGSWLARGTRRAMARTAR